MTHSQNQSDQVFEKRANKYDNLSWVFDAGFRNTILELITPHRTDLLLDLGTGTGAVAEFISASVGKVVAVDNSESMLLKAQERLRLINNVDIILADGEATGFPDAHFDIIVARNSLHHFNSPVRGLREVRRLLKVRGIFALIEPVAPDLRGKPLWSELFRIRDKGRHPDFYFTPAELRDYVTHYFEAVANHTFRFTMTMANWLDTGCVSPAERQTILNLLKVSDSDVRESLGLVHRDNEWYMNHSWELLKLG